MDPGSVVFSAFNSTIKITFVQRDEVSPDNKMEVGRQPVTSTDEVTTKEVSNPPVS